MDVDRLGAASAVQVDFEGLISDGFGGEDRGSDGELEDEEEDLEDWLRMSPEEEHACQVELQSIRDIFQDDVDHFDTTMVAEYADEIFAHMEELEVSLNAFGS